MFNEFIWIILFIFLIIGLIKPEIFLRNSKKPTRFKIVFYWILCIIIFSLVTTPKNKSNDIKPSITSPELEADTSLNEKQDLTKSDSLIKISQRIKKEMDSISQVTFNSIKLRDNNQYVNPADGNIIANIEDDKTKITNQNNKTINCDIIDPKNLAIGNSYSLSKQTPLMPELDPVNPEEALKHVKYLSENNIIYILDIKYKNANPWYRVIARKLNNDVIGVGFVNSIALIGQNLTIFNSNSKINSSNTSNYNSAKKWYEGGNLHNVNSFQWKKATYQNKLATASDWLSSTIWKGYLNIPNDFEKLRNKSNMLVNAIDQVVSDTNTEVKVSEIATFLITMSNDLGPY